MPSDHASRVTTDERVGSRGSGAAARARAMPLRPAPHAASAPSHRFDAIALAAVDHLLLRLLYAAAALLAVVGVLGLRGPIDHAQWIQWRAWIALFPAAMLLMPLAPQARFNDPRLNEALALIGLLLRSIVALIALQGLLWAAGHEPLASTSLVAILALHVALGQGARHVLWRVTRHWRRMLRIVIVGAQEQGIAIAAHLEASDAKVEIVGFVDDRRTRVDPAGLPAPFLGGAVEFMREQHDVDGIVIALPNHAADRVQTLVAALRAGLVHIYLAPDTPVLRRPLVRRQAGSALETMMLLGMDRLPLPGRIVKRLFDIAFSATALLLFLPAGLVICALIKLESPGPVIFRQPRYGLGNRLFDVYKFRSMRHDPAAGAREIRLTQRGDSRVTRTGEFLRRTSLDEFPQFLNVLLGHMSVVGPRPHPPGVKAGERVYEEVVADFMERYKVRPGITGWAQVNGLRGNTFTEQHLTQRFAHDIQYMRNWSFELDLWIVLRTVWGGFGGTNAF